MATIVVTPLDEKQKALLLCGLRMVQNYIGIEVTLHEENPEREVEYDGLDLLQDLGLVVETFLIRTGYADGVLYKNRPLIDDIDALFALIKSGQVEAKPQISLVYQEWALYEKPTRGHLLLNGKEIDAWQDDAQPPWNKSTYCRLLARALAEALEVEIDFRHEYEERD